MASEDEIKEPEAPEAESAMPEDAPKIYRPVQKIKISNIPMYDYEYTPEISNVTNIDSPDEREWEHLTPTSDDPMSWEIRNGAFDAERQIIGMDPHGIHGHVNVWSEPGAPRLPHGNEEGVESTKSFDCPRCRQLVQFSRSRPEQVEINGQKFERNVCWPPCQDWSEDDPDHAYTGGTRRGI